MMLSRPFFLLLAGSLFSCIKITTVKAQEVTAANDPPCNYESYFVINVEIEPEASDDPTICSTRQESLRLQRMVQNTIDKKFDVYFQRTERLAAVDPLGDFCGGKAVLQYNMSSSSTSTTSSSSTSTSNSNRRRELVSYYVANDDEFVDDDEFDNEDDELNDDDEFAHDLDALFEEEEEDEIEVATTKSRTTTTRRRTNTRMRGMQKARRNKAGGPKNEEYHDDDRNLQVLFVPGAKWVYGGSQKCRFCDGGDNMDQDQGRRLQKTKKEHTKKVDEAMRLLEKQYGSLRATAAATTTDANDKKASSLDETKIDNNNNNNNNSEKTKKKNRNLLFGSSDDITILLDAAIFFLNNSEIADTFNDFVNDPDIAEYLGGAGGHDYQSAYSNIVDIVAQAVSYFQAPNMPYFDEEKRLRDRMQKQIKRVLSRKVNKGKRSCMLNRNALVNVTIYPMGPERPSTTCAESTFLDERRRTRRRTL